MVMSQPAKDYWIDGATFPRPPVRLELVNSHDSTAADVKKLISWIGVGWAAWALAGGLYFILAGRRETGDSQWLAFGNKLANGYTVVGVALILCGVISVLGMCNARLNRIAAPCCAGWCLATAVVLQLYTPEFAIDAWLLLICSFSCVMRWALLVLEPHIVNR